MMVETIRIVADWLKGATAGVATILATQPVDGTDSGVVVPTVAEETTDSWVSRNQAPLSLAMPALAVGLAGDVAIPTHASRSREGGAFLEATVPIAVTYLDRDPTSQRGTRDAYYVLRAVAASLLALNQQAAGASKVRGATGVQLVQVLSLTQVQGREPVGDLLIMGGLVAECRVRVAVPFLT